MATSTLGNGTLVLAGTTSGTTTLQATAVAGTTTLTLPAATDTLVGKATTDTLTNKTLTGAVMNGTVGATTPSTGAFTTLTSTGASSFATSSGDVGIGTSSPTSRLHVSNSTASTNAIAQFTNGTTGTGAGNGLYVGVDTSNEATVFNFYNSALKFGTNAAERMRLDSSGNLGIGTSSPATKMQISAAEPKLRITSTAGSGKSWEISSGGGTTVNAGQFCIYDTTTDAQRFNVVSGTGNMTLDASGNLLVGTTDNSNLASAQGLYLRGTGADNCLYGLNNATTNDGVSLALFYSSFSTANQTKFEVKSDGDVFSRTNSYGGFSDVRLKQGITPASSQWSDIKNIEVVKFQMKSEQFSDAENPWMLGVIAQQVEQVSPGLVDEDVKDGIKTVKYSILYMKAVKALQEAMERIEQLETRITALEGA